jgi:hypothetical protein
VVKCITVLIINVLSQNTVSFLLKKYTITMVSNEKLSKLYFSLLLVFVDSIPFS